MASSLKRSKEFQKSSLAVFWKGLVDTPTAFADMVGDSIILKLTFLSKQGVLAIISVKLSTISKQSLVFSNDIVRFLGLEKGATLMS